MSIQKQLKEMFNDLVGELKIQKINNTVLISGNVYVSDVERFKKELMNKVGEKYPATLISNGLKVNEFSVVEDEIDTM